MPRLGWFALGSGVGVLLGLWIARASDEHHLAPVGSEEAEVGGVVHAGAVRTVPVEVPSPHSAEPLRVDRPDRTTATPVAAAELQARIEELSIAGAADREVEALLVERVQLGDTAGVDFALDWMERRELSSNAMFWSRLFQGVDDSRIGATAREVLAANQAQQLNSWVHTKGYVDLMASHGGPAEAAAVVQLLGDRDLAYFASTVIADLAGKVDGGRLLEALAGDLEATLAENVALGLAQWRESRTSSDLWSLAVAPATRASTRASVFRGLATAATGASAAAFVRRYFELHGAEERVAFLCGLEALDCEAQAGACLAGWVAVLESALSDDDRAVRAEALRRLRERTTLHTPDLLTRLRALALASDDSDELELVEDVIERVERSLG